MFCFVKIVLNRYFVGQEMISAVFYAVLSLYVFTDDRVQFPGQAENWASYADNCNAFALTCVCSVMIYTVVTELVQTWRSSKINILRGTK